MGRASRRKAHRRRYATWEDLPEFSTDYERDLWDLCVQMCSESRLSRDHVMLAWNWRLLRESAPDLLNPTFEDLSEEESYLVWDLIEAEIIPPAEITLLPVE